MNTRYLEEDDIDEIPRDREISLGATTILGIFFLLALICAVFFGFGYSLGRKSSASAIATSASSDTVEASSIKTTGTPKPAPGITPPADSAETVSEPVESSSPEPTQTKSQAETTDQPAPHPSERVKPAPAAKAEVASVQKPLPPAAASPAPASVAGVPSLVQVAAVSHQEDADMLVNALKRRGYNVAVRHEPQDKLLHVQIGPLPNRVEADAMRQRLLADGYKAIVK